MAMVFRLTKDFDMFSKFHQIAYSPGRYFTVTIYQFALHCSYGLNYFEHIQEARPNLLFMHLIVLNHYKYMFTLLYLTFGTLSIYLFHIQHQHRRNHLLQNCLLNEPHHIGLLSVTSTNHGILGSLLNSSGMF